MFLILNNGCVAFLREAYIVRDDVTADLVQMSIGWSQTGLLIRKSHKRRLCYFGIDEVHEGTLEFIKIRKISGLWFEIVTEMTNS